MIASTSLSRPRATTPASPTRCGIVRPRGTLVLKSTFHGNANINLTKLVVAEITVVGSRCGPFAPALRLLEQRRGAGAAARRSRSTPG